MRFMGIDYGSRRIGIAVSDESGRIAFPRTALPNDSSAVSTIKNMLVSEGVAAIVVGDTRSHGGAENPVTKAADDFIALLARETGMPVSRAFEAWSSVEAARYAPKGKEHDDAAAAAIVLQRYLDMKGDSVQ